MRLKSLFAALAGLFIAGPIAAQAPAAAPAAVPVVAPALAPENTLHLDLSTGGRVSIQLRPDAAPNHVQRIKTLTKQGFYNGLVFHRVIEGFMAQTGDPTGTGMNGSELADMAPEFNTLPHVRGTVSMARAQDPNTANSQFFIMLTPRLTLDKDYTVFGRVVGGMNYVDSIARGEPPANPSRILRATLGTDNVPPMTPAEIAAATPVAVVPVADVTSIVALPEAAPAAAADAAEEPESDPQL